MGFHCGWGRVQVQVKVKFKFKFKFKFKCPPPSPSSTPRYALITAWLHLISLAQPFRDFYPVIHHRDPLAYPHYHPHIMLDQ